ncbi:MAG: T9SS type A sorting domain-containing protein [Bacteroidales bacterium]|jgi:hypothetical protein|nr:T9SS type A sorting domain-containing protein [Bacteroidales bacterium]
MNKKLLTLLAILFSFAIVNGQSSMYINLADHSSVSVALSNIQKITFDSNSMLLKTTGGTVNSYLLDNIASITFFSGTGIEQFADPVDIHIFVNGSGEIVVETPHQINQLTVFDLTGRAVAAGIHSKLNVNFLSTGIYILQVATNKGLVSKKFIKNR